MNFFGVGPLELGLIVVIAVVVLGPDRLPEVAVQVARAIRYLRGYATSATAQMRKDLDELTKDYEDVRRELQLFRDSVRKDVKSIGDKLETTFGDDEPIIEPGGEKPPAAKTGAESPDKAAAGPPDKTE
jgi:sec-independent protein translocase protein TatB